MMGQDPSYGRCHGPNPSNPANRQRDRAQNNPHIAQARNGLRLLNQGFWLRNKVSPAPPKEQTPQPVPNKQGRVASPDSDIDITRTPQPPVGWVSTHHHGTAIKIRARNDGSRPILRSLSRAEPVTPRRSPSYKQSCQAPRAAAPRRPATGSGTPYCAWPDPPCSRRHKAAGR